MAKLIESRVRLISALTYFALVGAGCGGSNSSPTSPSPAPFTQTFTGTAVANSVATHSVSIPRAGNGTVTVTGFSSGQFPQVEVRNAAGTVLGRSSCGDAFCSTATPVTLGSLQPGTLELRVSMGTTDRLASARYTLVVNVN